MEKGVGSDGVEVEGFEGSFDLVVVFLLERWKLGWLLSKDFTPFGSDGVKYVDWVCDGLVVMVDSSEAGGVFIFEVGKTLVLVLLKTVLPIIDAVVFLLLFVVLLYGEQCIDDGLALC